MQNMLFYAKPKMSMFASCEVGRLKKKKKKRKKTRRRRRRRRRRKRRNWQFSHFLYVIVAVYFMYFESFIVYKNIRRPCYVSEKAYNCPV